MSDRGASFFNSANDAVRFSFIPEIMNSAGLNLLRSKTQGAARRLAGSGR